jgi:tRNA(Ile)-lysidine synthase
MTEFLQRLSGLVSKDEPLLVGVSGGVDSMVRMHLLAQGSRVEVAHLNHRLRGKSSDADERLVRRMAEKLGLTCHVERVEVKTAAREHKLSIEMAARQCRHEFYARVATQRGIRKIALAHHADDQVELFFVRLLRGAGPEGLAGMPEMSPSPVDPSLTIVRPLLGLTKEEIRDYATEHKIPFREDASNASVSILRNRIRHKLIPLLKRGYQPGLTQTILRAMDLIGAESEYVAQESERHGDPFENLPLALQRRRIQEQLYAAGIEANFDLIEELRLNPGMSISVNPEQLVARDASGSLKTSQVPHWSTDSVSVSVAKPGSIDFAGVTIRWSTTSGKPAKNSEYFDADRIGGSVIVRHWQPGDRFQPIGMPAAVKLQDLFTNLKVSRDKRHGLVVASTASGEIFWVEGVRIGEKFKIGPSTKRRLKWSWRRHGTC